MNQPNFNVEIFNIFRFDSTPNGSIKCPDNNCGFNIALLADEDDLTRSQKNELWSHVEELHHDLFASLYERCSTKAIFIPREDKIDRALELIGVSNAKINQIMVKLSMNALNEKQTLQLISEENKQMEHKLAEVLLGYSTLSQQHTTSSLGSL
ncbi:unnamed protein product [Rotaria socialis]